MADPSALVEVFIEHTESEDPKLARALERLKDDGDEALGDVLCRFDRAKNGALDDADRALARRVLTLLHRPSPKGLELLGTILTYLDVNTNNILEHQEATLAVEILELFCKADSENDTLSNKELEVLQAVLAHLDTDGNGVIDPTERNKLRDELWEPEKFLAGQRAENPLVREVLGLD